jgi:hypothetical protein
MDVVKRAKRVKSLKSSDAKRRKRMADLGVEYDFPTIVRFYCLMLYFGASVYKPVVLGFYSQGGPTSAPRKTML